MSLRLDLFEEDVALVEKIAKEKPVENSENDAESDDGEEPRRWFNDDSPQLALSFRST